MANNRRAQGTGSIYKKTVTRNGKEYSFWEAQATIGYDSGTGKQIRKSFTGKTQKEVREKMQAAAVAVQSGDYFEPAKMTLGEWLDIWLAEYCGDKKYLTVKQYRSMAETHIKPALGAVKLSKLTTPHIQKFYNELSRTGRTRQHKNEKGNKVITKEQLSPKTIKNIHGILTKCLSTAIDIGYMKTNPADRAKPPRIDPKEIAPLTEEQLRAFLQACETDEFAPIYKLIVFTGLREGEALGLTWDCVDFKNGTLKINKQLQKRPQKDGGYTLAPLKNDKARIVAMSPFVMQILKQQYNRQTESRLAAGDAWQGWQSMEERKSGLVFTKVDGNNLSSPTVYNHYKRIAASIGAPHSRVHDLRHTYAVLALQNGDNVKTVQTALGHATAAFTLDVYGHTTDKMRQESAARMQKYIESVI